MSDLRLNLYDIRFKYEVLMMCACARCNRSKGAMHLDDWMARQKDREET